MLCRPLHPFHPTCVNHWRAPLSTCFPSPLSPLWRSHHHIALASPVPVWRHAIVPLPLPCWHHLCICTTATTIATTTAIHLSPYHCCWRTSLTSDVSSLALLANADANTVKVSPRLWRCWRRRQCRCHHCIFFCRPHCPMCTRPVGQPQVDAWG